MACTDEQRASIRDVVISHTHLDHIAGLPLFIDDLFSTLTEPVCVHASAEAAAVLEEHIFNWSVYPRFSELDNDFGPVMKYRIFRPDDEFRIGDYTVLPVEVNHKVPSCGFIVSDGSAAIASTGDTAPTEAFWQRVNNAGDLDAILIECAFPNEMAELAAISYHLTPSGLASEIAKIGRADCPVFVSNIKPAFRREIVAEIEMLGIDRLEVLEVGREYVW